jgi:hypothetical protein
LQIPVIAGVHARNNGQIPETRYGITGCDTFERGAFVTTKA